MNNPKQFAKTLRQNMTDAERLLWRHLRAHRLAGEKFRRQQALGPYIVDFVHFGKRLIVEVDGGQHNGSKSDQRRDAWLEAQRFKVLRFWNDDVLLRAEAVLETIWRELSPSPPAPLPSRERRENRSILAPSREKDAAITLPSPLAGEGPGERGPSNNARKKSP